MNRAPRCRWLTVLMLCGLLLASVALSAACSAFHSWEDDHIVLNEMELLAPNDLWFELLDIPAEPIECSFALCQSLLRGKDYEVTGDFELAKEVAMAELLERWVLIDDESPLAGPDSTLFQLRDDVEIATTTGTAYLRLSFGEDVQLGSITVDALIGVTVSSDLPV